ncbi:hypothetical protein [Pedobacter paludis]|nr:hypothetical protein [Pedobacter paludis]
MKINYSYLLVFALPVLMMCRNSSENENMEKLTQLPPNSDCFMAVDGKDSAFLKINTTGKNAVNGHLSILYANTKEMRVNLPVATKGIRFLSLTGFARTNLQMPFLPIHWRC